MCPDQSKRRYANTTPCPLISHTSHTNRTKKIVKRELVKGIGWDLVVSGRC